MFNAIRFFNLKDFISELKSFINENKYLNHGDCDIMIIGYDGKLVKANYIRSQEVEFNGKSEKVIIISQ